MTCFSLIHTCLFLIAVLSNSTFEEEED